MPRDIFPFSELTDDAVRTRDINDVNVCERKKERESSSMVFFFLIQSSNKTSKASREKIKRVRVDKYSRQKKMEAARV